MQTIIQRDVNHEALNWPEEQEQRLVRDYISKLIDQLAANDYQVYLDGDLLGWVEHMETAPSIAAVNSAFDPRRSTIGQDEGFWVRIEHEGEIVGTACNRLFVTDDHIQEQYVTQRIWADKEPPEHPVDIRFPANGVTLSGNVVHEGGAWVRPDHRGYRLANRMLWLARAVSIRNWDADLFTGTVLEALFDKGVSKTHYEMPHDALLLDGWCPPMRQSRRMHILWMWKREALDHFVSETAREHARA